MFWCLVRLSTGALCGGLYTNLLEIAIQSAVACSEVKDDGPLVLWQLMECVQVWVVSFSLAVEDGLRLLRLTRLQAQLHSLHRRTIKTDILAYMYTKIKMEMDWTHSKNERQQIHQALHRVQGC